MGLDIGYHQSYPLTLGESKTQISDAKEFVRTLTLSKVQQEQLTDGDAAQEDQE